MVVKDLDKAIKIYCELLRLKVRTVEQSEVFQVKIAFIPCGEVLVELLGPIGPSVIQDFLEEYSIISKANKHRK